VALTKAELDKLQTEARARYNRHEQQLLPHVTAALNAYLAVCRARLQQSAWGLAPLVAAGPIASPVGEPHGFTIHDAETLTATLDQAKAEWPGILDTKLMPGYGMLLGQLPEDVDLTHPTVASSVQAWRSEWLQERTQVLVGVPDDVTSQLRTEMDRLATEHGTSVFDARVAAQEMLDQGYPSWKNRAELIARTETVAANNQGSLRAWTAMAEAGGVADSAMKTWVGGTRPTHSAVSGATVGLREKFVVGGQEMNGPGDPAGGAAEVANCRCALSYELPDTATVPLSGGDGAVLTESAGLAEGAGLDEAAAGEASAEEAPPEDTGPGIADLIPALAAINLTPTHPSSGRTIPDVTPDDDGMTATGLTAAACPTCGHETFATGDTMTTPEAPPVPAPAQPSDPQPPAESSGLTWSGPLALLDTPSSDRRKLAATGGVIRPLPLPISWQERTDDRHAGAVIVGRILTAEIRDGQLWGHGDYLNPGCNSDAEKAIAQVDAGLGLISVDTAPTEVSFEDGTGAPVDPMTYPGDPDDIILVFTQWEFGGATIVSFPAFADARIANDQPAEEISEIIGGPLIMPGTVETFAGANPEGPTLTPDGQGVVLTDGTTVAVGDLVGIGDPDGDGDVDTGTITGINSDALTVDVTMTPDADDADTAVPLTVPIADLVPGAADQNPPGPPKPPPAALVASIGDAPEDPDMALLASSASEPYNSQFFARRELLGPTPLTVNRDTGEVYGHFGQWGECHIGKLAETGMCTTVPQTKHGYDYFHVGEVITDQGPLPIGKITIGQGHYTGKGWRGAVEHYDRTGSIVAVVRAYEDDWGGQFAGQLRRGVQPEQVDELMAAGQVSGDWRMLNGNLELVHILGVNVGGFPKKRLSPVVGMVGGRQVSLVAAGVVYPEEHPKVRLPSGAELDRDEWDTLVAAAVEAQDRNTQRLRRFARATATLAEQDKMALRRARARAQLALASR